MKKGILLGLIFFAATDSLLVADEATGKPPITLSEEDKRFLAGLIGNPLADPIGKEFGTIRAMAYTCWGGGFEAHIPVWREAAGKGGKARIHYVDGDVLDAPKEFNPLNLHANAKGLNLPLEGGEDEDDVFRKMRLTGMGSAGGVPDLARAAWLAKLGHDKQAAAIIWRLKNDKARRIDEPDDETPYDRMVRRLKTELAWHAYADAVHGFMHGADKESLRHMKRLKRLYPAFMDEFGDGESLLWDLERRQKAGVLGETESKKPEDFEKWKVERRVAWLIRELDQVNARQWGQPGGVSLVSDWRVQGLIDIGDPAVGPLIDVIESDKRLIRSVHFWRDFHTSRTVMSVREAALTAVMSIVKVSFFDAASTSDNFTSRGEEKAAETARALRRYWDLHGKTPFEERMMKVLLDEKSPPDQLREAAVNIAEIGLSRTFGTTVWTSGIIDKKEKKKENPALRKFSNPTAAEAILAAMERDMKQNMGAEQELHRLGNTIHDIEDTYLYALTELGDKRIAPELVKRADAAQSFALKREYAHAAHLLGMSQPIREFANSFKAGKLACGEEELLEIVRVLSAVQLKEADEAMHSLVDPKHPGHGMARDAVYTLSGGWSGEEGWFAHPYCVRLLRKELDNLKPTGTTAFIELKDDSYRKESEGSSSVSSIPEIIADPAVRLEKKELRRCDEVAEKLHQLIIGLPPYHPLLKDSDERLAQMRKVLDEKIDSLRIATQEERNKHGYGYAPAFIFD